MAYVSLVSHFVISSIFELFEIAGVGALIYLVMMFLVGGFSDHELSLIRRYYSESKAKSNNNLPYNN